VVQSGNFAKQKPIFLAGIDQDAHDDPYTGGFFKGLWQGEGKEFIVAYPNLYVVDAQGKWTLLTHGQYFDAFWNGLGRVVQKTAYDEVRLQDPTGKSLSIRELVQLNYPTSILNASAIGQAGIFADLARHLHDDFGKNQFDRAQKILNRIFGLLREQVKHKGVLGWCKGLLAKWMLSRAQKWIEGKIFVSDNPQVARFNQDYVRNNQQSIEDYLCMSEQEIRSILPNDNLQRTIQIDRLVFGHTHEPSRAGEQEKLVMPIEGHPVVCRNTGGWVLNAKQGFDASVAIFAENQWSMIPIARADAKSPCQVGQAFPI
jgi:UDP-2,3-diacylglucosamine pyrophosphatase LpxH